jgi:hypothetical protein
MKTMGPGKGTTPPRKRRTTMSRPRKTRWQEVSCAPGRPMKMTMDTTSGTPMMAATAAAVMTMAMSAQFLQSSAASSQAPTGGRLASMYQADRLALGALGPSLVMTPSFFYEFNFLLISCLSESRFTRSRWQHIDYFPNSVDLSLNRYLN